MSLDSLSLLENGLIVLLAIVLSKLGLDYYFSKQTQKRKSKVDVNDSKVLESSIPMETLIRPVVTPQKRYSLYPPTVFSKYRTRQFYVYSVFQSFDFFEDKWMETLAEILMLLEIADESTVRKEGSKSIKLVIGTRGVANAKMGEAYEAYYISELCICIADKFAHLYEGGDYIKEIVLAILLMHIDEVEEIRHWSMEISSDGIRSEIARYLLRRLLDEEQALVLHFVNIIHSKEFYNGVLSALESVISTVKKEIKITSKVITNDLFVESWPRNFHTKNLRKQAFTMDQIERF